MLINWRRSMGKEGIVIVTKALRADDISEEEAPKVAAFLLDSFSFFYENPKSTVSFLSSVVIFSSKTKEGFDAALLHQRLELT